jgi:hypothetical protein
VTAPAASAKSAAEIVESIAREAGDLGDAIRLLGPAGTLKLCDGIAALSVAIVNAPLPPFPPPDEWRIDVPSFANLFGATLAENRNRTNTLTNKKHERPN